MTLTSQVQNYEALVARLSTLARFIILDLGSGLPSFVQKILPMCNECIVVVEGASGTIQHTKLLIEDIVDLKVDTENISVVLNNRMRSEVANAVVTGAGKTWTFHCRHTDTRPEAFQQAVRLQTPAVICQPTNMTSQQFLKIADTIIEREKSQ